MRGDREERNGRCSSQAESKGAPCPSFSISLPLPHVLVNLPVGSGARHAVLSPLSRACLLSKGEREGERERECEPRSFLPRPLQIRLLKFQLFFLLLEKVRRKNYFFFPVLFISASSHRSMLARRASSCLSFRSMGASLSLGTEAAKAAAGREAEATTKATTPPFSQSTASTSASASTSTPAPSTSTPAPKKPLAPPIEPGPEDCCQSGCAECVWEVYYRERREYERALAEQQQQQKGSATGGTEEPAGASPPPPPLDAFAALEAKVAAQEAEKKKSRAAAEAKS